MGYQSCDKLGHLGYALVHDVVGATRGGVSRGERKTADVLSDGERTVAACNCCQPADANTTNNAASDTGNNMGQHVAHGEPDEDRAAGFPAEMLRLNGICPYFSMFPLDFPLAHLSQAGPGEWVLDPFCGRGTTNYAARLLGLPSVGVDRCRVAVTIAAAKMVHVTPEEVTALCARILQGGADPVDVPTGPFWDPRSFGRREGPRRRDPATPYTSP